MKVKINRSVLTKLIIDGETYNIGLSIIDGITISKKTKTKDTILRQHWNLNPLRIQEMFKESGDD